MRFDGGIWGVSKLGCQVDWLRTDDAQDYGDDDDDDDNVVRRQCVIQIIGFLYYLGEGTRIIGQVENAGYGYWLESAMNEIYQNSS